MGRVYTFGPTFRADSSDTRRHLSEFWMLEPEGAFLDLPALLKLAEDYVRGVVADSLQHCKEDLAYLSGFERFLASHNKAPPPVESLEQRLRQVAEEPFACETYTNCLEILAQQKDLPALNWGDDLNSEHERFLSERAFGRPVFVTHYPASLKPFYMRESDSGGTVECVDLLVPGIGEILGGSVREERLQPLVAAMTRSGMDLDAYRWYTDLRRYGSVPHAGFGVGFERLIMLLTGMQNVRDVIPFPRYPGKLDL